MRNPLEDCDLEVCTEEWRVQKVSENESIKKSVEERQSASKYKLSWPCTGDSPISEFNTEGYMSLAFPTLFTTGDAEFLAPRQYPITIGNYFKHLLRYGRGHKAF